jgi:hypothetical protein
MKLPELKLLPVSEDVEWIEVSERLPEPKTMCLVYGKRDGIQISYFTPASKFALDVLYNAGITHWMKLPEVPSA